MIRQVSFSPDEHQTAFFIVLADALARARSCETGADDEVIPGDHRNCLTLVKISFVSAELSVSFFAASNRHVGGAFNAVYSYGNAGSGTHTAGCFVRLRQPLWLFHDCTFLRKGGGVVE